ncbi:hypothetical protein GCM10023319_23040 [Nocardia iowensis]
MLFGAFRLEMEESTFDDSVDIVAASPGQVREITHEITRNLLENLAL